MIHHNHLTRDIRPELCPKCALSTFQLVDWANKMHDLTRLTAEQIWAMAEMLLQAGFTADEIRALKPESWAAMMGLGYDHEEATLAVCSAVNAFGLVVVHD